MHGIFSCFHICSGPAQYGPQKFQHTVYPKGVSPAPGDQLNIQVPNCAGVNNYPMHPVDTMVSTLVGSQFLGPSANGHAQNGAGFQNLPASGLYQSLIQPKDPSIHIQAQAVQPVSNDQQQQSAALFAHTLQLFAAAAARNMGSGTHDIHVSGVGSSNSGSVLNSVDFECLRPSGVSAEVSLTAPILPDHLQVIWIRAYFLFCFGIQILISNFSEVLWHLLGRSVPCDNTAYKMYS